MEVSERVNALERTPKKMTEQGHLTTLLRRVREDEAVFNHVRKEHLINLAEYILSWPSKFSKSEYYEAIRVLANYHLAPLAGRRRGWDLIQRELEKPYRARCRRCGLPISNRVSLTTGYGHVCRRKLGITQIGRVCSKRKIGKILLR
jgi:hypothetical protein